MYNLPPQCAINKPLFKKAVYEKFNLKAAERDRFDADISRMVLVARVSSATVPALTKGKEIEGFYVLQVALKRKDYDSKNILMLQKLIPQKLIFALQFEEQTQFCIFHTRLQHSAWMPTDEATITLQGLSLDDVWNNIVATIGGLDAQAEDKHQEHISSVKNALFALMSGNMKEAVLIILQQMQKDMEDFVEHEANRLRRFIFGDANDIDSRRVFVSNSFVWARVLASVEKIDYKKSSFNSLQQDALRVADGTWQSWRDEKEKLFTDAVDAILELGNSASQKHFSQEQAERIIRYANHTGDKPFEEVTEELWQKAKPQIPDYWRDIAADAVNELDDAVEKQIEMQRSKGMGGR